MTVARRCLRCLALLAAALSAVSAAADTPEPRSSVEAAFLRNFARYVGWPPAVFRSPQAPWLVCVYGDDGGDAVDRTLRGRVEQGRGFEVLRARRPEELQNCQIVLVLAASAAARRAALAVLQGRPVLTVGRDDDFLADGGIVRLRANDRMEMSINLDQARAASLSIPAKVLEVAAEVVENGGTRRWR